MDALYCLWTNDAYFSRGSVKRGTLKIVLAKICPTRKNRVRTRIFRPNFQSGHYIFYISIVRTRFWPEFTLVRIVRPEKNRVSDINFSSKFWHCPNCPTRIWPEPEFLPALPKSPKEVSKNLLGFIDETSWIRLWNQLGSFMKPVGLLRQPYVNPFLFWFSNQNSTWIYSYKP